MSQRFPSTLVRRRTVLAAMVLAAVGAGAGIDHAVERRREAARALNFPEGNRAKPGPWGELFFTPFTIAAPDEALPIRALEAKGTHWVFPDDSEEDVRKLLESAGVSRAGRDAMLDPAVCHAGPAGLDVEPPFAALVEMPDEARRKIYQHLALFPENQSALTFIHKATFDVRFEGSGLSRETLQLFRRLCWEHGDYFVMSGLEAMLAQLPSYEEKVRFLKALTRQRTMLARLFIGPETDLVALAAYWGKGSYGTDVHTILESVAAVKGGTWVDLPMLLPPRATSQLYYYPIVTDNPLDGPGTVRDCHWTSFNFFRDKPDPNFSQPGYTMQLLRENYYPAPGDPRYGDLLLLTKPDGTALHSAIYLADDVVYSKNGATMIYPWMLCTVSDLLNQYSFRVEPGEKVNISYFRNRTL